MLLSFKCCLINSNSFQLPLNYWFHCLKLNRLNRYVFHTHQLPSLPSPKQSEITVSSAWYSPKTFQPLPFRLLSAARRVEQLERQQQIDRSSDPSIFSTYPQIQSRAMPRRIHRNPLQASPVQSRAVGLIPFSILSQLSSAFSQLLHPSPCLQPFFQLFYIECSVKQHDKHHCVVLCVVVFHCCSSQLYLGSFHLMWLFIGDMKMLWTTWKFNSARDHNTLYIFCGTKADMK